MQGKNKKTIKKTAKKPIKTAQKTFNMALDLEDEQLTTALTPLASQATNVDDQFVVYKGNVANNAVKDSINIQKAQNIHIQETIQKQQNKNKASEIIEKNMQKQQQNLQINTKKKQQNKFQLEQKQEIVQPIISHQQPIQKTEILNIQQQQFVKNIERQKQPQNSPILKIQKKQSAIQNKNHQQKHVKQQEIDLQVELQEGQHFGLSKKAKSENKSKSKKQSIVKPKQKKQKKVKKQSFGFQQQLVQIEKTQVQKPIITQDKLKIQQIQISQKQLQQIQNKQTQKVQQNIQNTQQQQQQPLNQKYVENTKYLKQSQIMRIQDKQQFKNQIFQQQSKTIQQQQKDEKKNTQQQIRAKTEEFQNKYIVSNPTYEQIHTYSLDREFQNMQQKLSVIVSKTQQLRQNLSKKSDRKSSNQSKKQQEIFMPKKQQQTLAKVDNIQQVNFKQTNVEEQKNTKKTINKIKQKPKATKNKPKTKANTTLKLGNIDIDVQEEEVKNYSVVPEQISQNVSKQLQKQTQTKIIQQVQIPKIQQKQPQQITKNTKVINNQKINQPAQIFDKNQAIRQQKTIEQAIRQQKTIEQEQIKQKQQGKQVIKKETLKNESEQIDLISQLSFFGNQKPSIKAQTKSKKNTKKTTKNVYKKGLIASNDLDQMLQQTPILKQQKIVQKQETPQIQQLIQKEKYQPQLKNKSQINAYKISVTKQDITLQITSAKLNIANNNAQQTNPKQPQVQNKIIQLSANIENKNIINNKPTQNQQQIIFDNQFEQKHKISNNTMKLNKSKKNTKNIKSSKVTTNLKTNKISELTEALQIQQQMVQSQYVITTQNGQKKIQDTKNYGAQDRKQQLEQKSAQLQKQLNVQAKQETIHKLSTSQPIQIKQKIQEPKIQQLKQQQKQIQQVQPKHQSFSIPQFQQIPNIKQQKGQTIKFSKNIVLPKKKGKKAAVKKTVLKNIDDDFDQDIVMQQSKKLIPDVQIKMYNEIQEKKQVAVLEQANSQPKILQMNNNMPQNLAQNTSSQVRQIQDFEQQKSRNIGTLKEQNQNQIGQTSVKDQQIYKQIEKQQQTSSLTFNHKQQIFHDFTDNKINQVAKPDNLHIQQIKTISQEVIFDQIPSFKLKNLNKGAKTKKTTKKADKKNNQISINQKFKNELDNIQQNIAAQEVIVETKKKQQVQQKIKQVQKIQKIQKIQKPQKIYTPLQNNIKQQQTRKQIAQAAPRPLKKQAQVLQTKVQHANKNIKNPVRQKLQLKNIQATQNLQQQSPQITINNNLVGQLVSIVTMTNRRNLNAMKQRLLMMKEDILSSLVRRQQKQLKKTVLQVHYDHVIQQNVELKRHLSQKIRQ